MAKVVVPRDQQAEVRRRYPRLAYSRVVSCGIVDDGIAVADYATTVALGQRLWLLNVKVFWNALGVVIDQITDFRIMTGTTAVGSAAEILTWENVLPNTMVTLEDQPWHIYDGEGCMSWDMKKLYVGLSRKFGIWADRRQDPGLTINVSFEISEG